MPTFEQRNVLFHGVATSRSTLSFDILQESGNLTNNATSITCIAQQGLATRVSGHEVQVIFYGKSRLVKLIFVEAQAIIFQMLLHLPLL